MSVMTAVIFEGKEKMRIAERPIPACGAREVLLQIAACGICGGDARSYFSGDQFTSKERIPGHEPVGVVAEAGKDNTGWKPGQKIALAADVHCGQCFYCKRGIFNMCARLRILGKHLDGGLADYLLLTEDILERGILNPVPEGLSLLHAAVSEPLCSVLASHDELNIQAGETVAVIGSGPMGILHLELLRIRKATVIIIDTSMERLERAKRDFGAEFTVLAGRDEPVERVREITDGVGADVAIVAAPSAAAVQQALRLVRKRGRIGAFAGLPAAEAEVPIDINYLHYNEIRIAGNFSYHPGYHAKALALLVSGAVRCDRLVTRYPIQETERGLHDIRAGAVLKAVVVPNEGALA